MNIKIKAILTVAAFFGTMVGMAWIIIHIPEKLLIDIFLGVLAIGCTAFAYWVALDYYKGVEELKEMQERHKKNQEHDLLKNIEIRQYDDGLSIRPPVGRRLPKKKNDSNN